MAQIHQRESMIIFIPHISFVPNLAACSATIQEGELILCKKEFL
jgi:hypothetical protein